MDSLQKSGTIIEIGGTMSVVMSDECVDDLPLMKNERNRLFLVNLEELE